MSKTNIVLLVSILIILVAGSVGIFLVLSPKQATDSSAASLANVTLPTAKPIVAANNTYEDEAGFLFKYPSDFKVVDITPSSEAYYSKLEISSMAGKITFNAMDTSYPDLSLWVNASPGVTLVGASVLGDVKASQYKKANMLMTVAIDRGVLYMLENISDGGSLDETQNIIVSTFKFLDQQTTANATTTTNSGENVEYEVEEVIE